MAGVVGKNNVQVSGILRVGRCLKGLIDGRAVFRFASEEPKRMKVNRRPGGSWIKEGWFSRNLLDE